MITLKTGQKIEAPVLKETESAIYIDLGYRRRTDPRRENRFANEGAGDGQGRGGGEIDDATASTPPAD